MFKCSDLFKLVVMKLFFFVQPRASDGRLPGQVHFENLCMKAVNQSIGNMVFLTILYCFYLCYLFNPLITPLQYQEHLTDDIA